MKQNWITEEKAAEMLGYTSLVWFRRLVKERKLEIEYTRVRGRYLYQLESINNVLLRNSTIVLSRSTAPN